MNAVLSERSELSAKVGIGPIIVVLRQLADLLHRTTDRQYTQKPVGVVQSSISGHVRHCLDHVDALLAGVMVGEMSYDHRQRGTDVEASRWAALKAIVRQEEELLGMLDWPLDHPIRLHTLMSATGPSVTVETTLGRELAFVMSHTIHHNALIGVMANLLGIVTPERFGYAPSTLAHLESRGCAL
ncbi:MAG: DinB family protein [Gemmataceae bacterium]|nr:DinB family protein [Gemmataceae bacterium]